MGEHDGGIKIGILHDSSFLKIKQLPEIAESPDEYIAENNTVKPPEETMSLDVNFYPVDGLTRADIFLVLCGYCTIEQVQQNNWRRLHGMTMRRKT